MLTSEVQRLRHLAHTLIDIAVGQDPDTRGHKRKAVYQWLAGQYGDAEGFHNGRRGHVHLRFIFNEEECRDIISKLLQLLGNKIPLETYLDGVGHPELEATNREAVEASLRNPKLLYVVDLAAITSHEPAKEKKKKKKERVEAAASDFADDAGAHDDNLSPIATRAREDLQKLLTSLERQEASSLTPVQTTLIDTLQEIALQFSEGVTENPIELVQQFLALESELFAQLHHTYLMAEVAMAETVPFPPPIEREPALTRQRSVSDAAAKEMTIPENELGQRRTVTRLHSKSDDYLFKRKAEERKGDKAAQLLQRPFKEKVAVENQAERERIEQQQRAREAEKWKLERQCEREREKALLQQLHQKKASSSQDAGAVREDEQEVLAKQEKAKALLAKIRKRQQDANRLKQEQRSERRIQRVFDAYKATKDTSGFCKLSLLEREILAQFFLDDQDLKEFTIGRYETKERLATILLDGSFGHRVEALFPEETNVTFADGIMWRIQQTGQSPEILSLGLATVPYPHFVTIQQILADNGVNCIAYDPSTIKEPGRSLYHNSKLFHVSGDSQVLQCIAQQLKAPSALRDNICIVFDKADLVCPSSVRESVFGNDSPKHSVIAAHRAQATSRKQSEHVTKISAAASAIGSSDDLLEYFKALDLTSLSEDILALLANGKLRFTYYKDLGDNTSFGVFYLQREALPSLRTLLTSCRATSYCNFSWSSIEQREEKDLLPICDAERASVKQAHFSLYCSYEKEDYKQRQGPHPITVTVGNPHILFQMLKIPMPRAERVIDEDPPLLPSSGRRPRAAPPPSVLSHSATEGEEEAAPPPSALSHGTTEARVSSAGELDRGSPEGVS